MDPSESLFNGRTDQLHLDADVNRKEEEEALEDQRRRDQELENLLVTAFDDLEDDDDNDLSSIIGSHHNIASEHSHPNSGDESASSQSDHVLTPANTKQFEMDNHHRISDHQQSYHSSEKKFERHCFLNGYETGNERCRTAGVHSYAQDDDSDQHDQGGLESQETDNFGYLSTIHPAEFTNGGVDCQNAQDFYRHADLNSQEQLMVLYGARMQEISRLTKEVMDLRLERDREVEQLKRKALLLEAEKQGAFLSHKEAQNLLADQKSSILKLHQEIEDLRLKNIQLEKSNEKLTKEFDTTKASAADLIQKITILERSSSGLQSEKHVESFIKTLQQKYDCQLRELQTQVDVLMKKLSQKDHECSTLERKLHDTQRTQEALMVEKGNVINELSRQLDEAQQRVREYASCSEGQETIRLKVQLEEARNERKALEEKLTSMSSKLESVERDLQQYESVTKMGLLGNGDSSFETDSITLLGMSRRHSSGSQGERKADSSKELTRHSNCTLRDRDDLHSKLREELHRALQGQRSKREEIKKLQEDLSARERKIKTMKEQEKVYFAEAEKFKKNLSAVLERLKRQEEEAILLKEKSEQLNSVRIQLHKVVEERDGLEKELNNTKVQLESIKSECSGLQKQLSSLELKYEQSKVNHIELASAEFLAFHDESLARLRQESSRHLEAQVIDFRVRMEQAQKECEELKRLYIEVCSAKRALLSQLKEEEARGQKLTSDLEDIKESQLSLEELHKQERELTRRLRDDLETERNKALKLSTEFEQQVEEKVKSRVTALQRDQESLIHNLEKARDDALSQIEGLKEKVVSLEHDVQHLEQLKEECELLRNEINDGPRRQQAEVERVSRELKQSRERVLQLEKRLRAEFQTQMDAMMAERDLIQSQLKQKDCQLEEYLHALSRLRPPSRDACTNTDIENANSIETLRRHFEEQVRKLEIQRAAAERQKLAALEAQYKVVIASTEERVKEQTVRYFAEEIARIEDKHRTELGALAKKLADAETVKISLQNKMKEIEDLQQKFKIFEDKGVLSQKDSEETVKLQGYIKRLQEQIENDRNKMADAMSKWAAEVKELQNRESKTVGELEQVREKYKHAKRVVSHYKKLSAERQKQMESECHRIEEGYREVLSRVKARVGDIVGGREQEVWDRLQRIESHYDSQIKELTQKLNQNKIS